MEGYFDTNGHPRIRMDVYGVLPEVAQTFEAMLDTGFSGFLLLPIALALPLGLILVSTASFTLAEGSVEQTLLCMGTVRIGDEKVSGLIALSKGDDVLAGMEFLRKAGKPLVLDCAQHTVRIG